MTENEKLDLILQKISGLDEKVEGIDKRVSGLDEKVDSIDKRVSSLETDMKEVRQQVAKTNFVLENEIRVKLIDFKLIKEQEMVQYNNMEEERGKSR